ncbi:hypothetical protein B0H15DRAFT_807294 [Mycena belliarum]|uniref:Uncharacterized protein n=1 Tax=Mycena belliarum TaxID=1033014 RepID=A0AAD6TNT8_9AGAR|nr:hypothetical protein B0H15DRAFT_807294 [Mycena belliae]
MHQASRAPAALPQAPAADAPTAILDHAPWSFRSSALKSQACCSAVLCALCTTPPATSATLPYVPLARVKQTSLNQPRGAARKHLPPHRTSSVPASHSPASPLPHTSSVRYGAIQHRYSRRRSGILWWRWQQRDRARGPAAPAGGWRTAFHARSGRREPVPVAAGRTTVVLPAQPSGMLATATRALLENLERIPDEDNITKIGIICFDVLQANNTYRTIASTDTILNTLQYGIQWSARRDRSKSPKMGQNFLVRAI